MFYIANIKREGRRTTATRRETQAKKTEQTHTMHLAEGASCLNRLPLRTWCSGITGASHAEGPGFEHRWGDKKLRERKREKKIEREREREREERE